MKVDLNEAEAHFSYGIIASWLQMANDVAADQAEKGEEVELTKEQTLSLTIAKSVRNKIKAAIMQSNKPAIHVPEIYVP